ncbi:uncharacterized protein BKA78DRAFT_126456 [Phyllosticta capitalensis]|uniref:uncharacterized protein n=1 Tax=Phyllosticta capitalensis TaxID=121624 RepID=UPI0031318755
MVCWISTPGRDSRPFYSSISWWRDRFSEHRLFLFLPFLVLNGQGRVSRPSSTDARATNQKSATNQISQPKMRRCLDLGGGFCGPPARRLKQLAPGPPQTASDNDNHSRHHHHVQLALHSHLDLFLVPGATFPCRLGGHPDVSVRIRGGSEACRPVVCCLWRICSGETVMQRSRLTAIA